MAIVLPMGVLSERLKWTLTKLDAGNLSSGGWISDDQFFFAPTTEMVTTAATTSIPSNKKVVKQTNKLN
jgi:hypothetical protein